MSRTAEKILQEEFLSTRSKILELAATLDRLDRADGSSSDLPQMKLIQAGLAILQETKSGRAERLQLLMSRAYAPNWQDEFEKARK